MISRVKSALHRVLTYDYEKTCGCTYRLKRKPLRERDAPNTEEVDRDLLVVYKRKYTNCTQREEEWKRRLRCLDCGAEYTTREKSGTCTDYGDENPDADAKLEVKSTRRDPLGGYRTDYDEVPVVEYPDKERDKQ